MTTAEKLAPEQSMELVRKAFPPKHDEFVRIFDLFHDGSYFRVNLHNTDTNKVGRSFFVQVKDGQVTVR